MSIFTRSLPEPRHALKEASWHDGIESLLALVFFVAMVVSVAGAGAAVTAPSVKGWYSTLAKPGFNPPDWAFAPVWTTLYIFIAVAAWRAWRKAGLTSVTLTFWFVQLALNFAWSFIFFGGHEIFLAMVDIFFLLGMLVVTTVAFWRIDRIAGVLFLPYVAWVSFATVLNVAIWQLNR